MKLKQFARMIFKNCPFLKASPMNYFEGAYAGFGKYMSKIPVCGAIILNPSLDRVLLGIFYPKISFNCLL